MGQTHFSGPVIAGTLTAGQTGGPNQGPVLLRQTVSLTQNSTTVVDATLYVPQGAEIVDILVDVLTVFNSAVSSTISVGKTSGGTEYASGVDAKTSAVRIRPTFTAAQLAAMKNISVLGVAVSAANQNKTIVVTQTPSGATSTGYAVVTIIYAQV